MPRLALNHTIRRLDAYMPPVPKKANPEILEHERKRQIELKILQFREAMEERNYSEEEIEAKVAEIRKQLTSVSGGGAAQKGKLSSHEIAARQQKKNAAFAEALGVRTDQRPGEAFNEEIQEEKNQKRQEQQQREWEGRQADRERKQRDYEDRGGDRRERGGDRRERERGDDRGPTNEKGLDDDLDAYMKKRDDRKQEDSDEDRRKRRRKDSDDDKKSKKSSGSDSSSSSSGSDSD